MTQEEFKAVRRGTGLSQQGIAMELGISRKTVNEMENGAAIDRRTELAMQTLARKIRLVSDVFWVEDSIRGTHIVVRRTVREQERPHTLHDSHAEVMLYGEFRRRADAERWWRALSGSDTSRNTQKLVRDRAAEVRRRIRAEIDAA